ncbi:capsular polysaccharide export protein, LipB/KpsS family [Peribacillus frigoritolerans]|uniref:capsular polysaccharide export protein, LipB/KpsS family n=1 Tax=Peribacillus frigoritolerans TaxID=450367 RepID=UPI00105A4DBA|nr:hypothetical protein [Peribacillus frigoritolerans]TDL78976.1 hypothetical protein E2R53_16165 [Peribacillus frigoritolerans]
MANYLFLRGNRNKKFFLDVAKELSFKGHKSFQLKFELGELLFKSPITSIFAPSKISSKKYPITDEELRELPIYNITYKQRILKKKTSTKELQLYKRYMYFIDQFIADHQIDIICLFNGYHWIDQITKVIANKRGLRTYYFEDGLFRPFTITCDPNGINADASVPRDPDFYDGLEVDSTRLQQFLHKPETLSAQASAKENLVKVAAVKAVSMFGSLLGIHPKFYAHITFWQAVKYFIYKKYFQYKKPDQTTLPDEYIFLPFQVSRDTQIFYNSPNISNMEELLDHVYKAVRSFNQKNGRNLQVIVKEHPEDISRNNYKDLKKRYRDKKEIIFVKKYDINKLITDSLAVVTINSTVGIESIAKHKPVITLGDAFYNIDGVVHHCDTPNQLDDYILKAINTTLNINRINKFIYYIRFHYQLEGSINRTDKQTSANVAARIDSTSLVKEF